MAIPYQMGLMGFDSSRGASTFANSIFLTLHLEWVCLYRSIYRKSYAKGIYHYGAE
jgi:hypothetical protein